MVGAAVVGAGLGTLEALARAREEPREALQQTPELPNLVIVERARVHAHPRVVAIVARRLGLDLGLDLRASPLVKEPIEFGEQRLVLRIARAKLHHNRRAGDDPTKRPLARGSSLATDEFDALERLERGLHRSGRQLGRGHKILNRRRPIETTQQLPDHQVGRGTKCAKKVRIPDIEWLFRSLAHGAHDATRLLRDVIGRPKLSRPIDRRAFLYGAL